MNAYYENQVLAIIVEKGGAYKRFTFKFASDFSGYLATATEIDQNKEINLIILDNGVAIGTNDDGFAELFSNNLSVNQVKVIQDTIFEDNKLFHVNNNVYYAEGSKVSAIRMK